MVDEPFRREGLDDRARRGRRGAHLARAGEPAYSREQKRSRGPVSQDLPPRLAGALKLLDELLLAYREIRVLVDELLSIVHARAFLK